LGKIQGKSWGKSKKLEKIKNITIAPLGKVELYQLQPHLRLLAKKQ
jgi:hypothetical protein